MRSDLRVGGVISKVTPREHCSLGGQATSGADALQHPVHCSHLWRSQAATAAEIGLTPEPVARSEAIWIGTNTAFPASTSSTDRRRARGCRRRREPIGGLSKRVLDVSISLLALVVLSPLILLTAALVRVLIGAPALFVQRRVGFDGGSFLCYKFRTMVPDADQVLAKYLAGNAGAAQEWREMQKLNDDPRVCSIGKILRKSSLDELPQLYNVLRGDMSLVGPRPIVESECVRYGHYLHECFKVRPGLSGLWQVSGRNLVSYDRRVALDRLYVRRWSIWLDLAILVRTVGAVFSMHKTS